jgi:hypothetical protein
MRAFSTALVLLAASVCLAPSLRAQTPAAAPGTTLSRFLTEPFKAAQAAQRAGNLGLEIQVLKGMQATPGKTGFDQYLISSWLAIAYVQQRDFTRAEPLLVAAAQSPYASAGQRKGFMEAAIGILGTPPRK